MNLSPDQIQSLLSQGAITPDQAQQLGQSAQAPAPVSAPPPNQTPADLPLPAQAPPAPPGPPPLPPGATKRGPRSAQYPDGIPTNDDGIPVPAAGLTAESMTPPSMRQDKPVPETDKLKGENTLASQVGAKPAGQGEAPPSTTNNPAQIYLPRAQQAGINLNPEKKLLKTTLGLSGEQVQEYQDNKDQELKINAAQDVANQAVASIQQTNSESMMKQQIENQTDWKKAMMKADEQSAEIVKRAREISLTKIDPERYDRDHPEAHLALAFGALGAALTGGPNTALEIYKQKIQEDISAQKTDIEVAYKALGMESDEAHSSLQRAQINAAYQDKQMMQRWELLKSQTQAIAAKAQSPIDKQKADVLANGIDDNIRNAKLSMAQNIYNFESLQRKAASAGAGASESDVRKYITDRKTEFMLKGDDEQTANDRAVKLAGERYGLHVKGGEANLPTLEDKKSKDERAKLTITLPNGATAEARSEAAAGEFSKRQMAIIQLNRITNRMQAIYDKNKGGTNSITNKADVAESESLQEQAINTYNELTGFNRAPGQPERVGLKGEVIPNISDYDARGGNLRKLQSLKSFVTQAYDANNITYLKDPKAAPPLDNAQLSEKVGAKSVE